MKATHCLFLGWNRAVPGHEKNSMEIFEGFLGYLGKLENDKKILNYEPVMLNAHGGDMNGFVLIRGTEEDLHKVTTTDDWQNWMVQGWMTMQGFGLIRGVMGDEMKTRMKRFQKYIK